MSIPVTHRFEITTRHYPPDHPHKHAAGECYIATVVGLQQYTGVVDEEIGLEEEILNDALIHVGSVTQDSLNKRVWYGGLGTGQECFSFRHAVAISLEDELTNAPTFMKAGMLFHAVEPFTKEHFWFIVQDDENLRYCTEAGVILAKEEIDEAHAHARDHSPLTPQERSALNGGSILEEEDDEAFGA